MEVLRAAAAEVSTSSVSRRLQLFRHTLPHVIAKASESPSDTALLVDIIFKTLSIYDDRASRKAVDDMVIQALGAPTFRKPFAAALVQSVEKDLKVANPFTSFKLLRWSHYLLQWSQFAKLPKGAFSGLANAQAILCQVLMDGSFRRLRTWKQFFTHLFSEPSGIYKMYIEEIRDLRISTRDSPAFLYLILDFTISSPSLSAEYKSLFLDLYVKTILNSKDKPPKGATEAFRPLFLEIGHEDFQNIIIPSCIRTLKRNPEILLQSIGYLLRTVRLDLSKYSMEFMPVVLHQARNSDEASRTVAFSIIGTLSEKSSDLEILPSMFNAIKAILGGSEGKLSLPYQRIGMINALEQLSRSPPKQIGRLAPSVSSFLLKCYKDDGIEEVKLKILSVLGSWTSVSDKTVTPDVVSFIAAGLKEKDTLRKGHLKLLRFICNKSDSLTKVTSLLDHLIQLSKAGFSKATQRLDGIYALFAVLRIAAVDTKADGALVKEKLWPLIAQNEPSLISIQLLSKLADDNCLATVDLLQSLLVEHLSRVRDHFSIQALLQLLIYLVCHPSWKVRKKAYNATKKILSSSGDLAEDLLFLFTNWLSLVGERLSVLKQGDTDNTTDSQHQLIPSTEVLVKCLLLIAPYAVEATSRSYSRLILCSHHPCLASSTSPAGVYKRLERRLRQQEILFVDLIRPNISVICKELFSQDGLFSSEKQVQNAASHSISTLLTVTPRETFLEFEKEGNKGGSQETQCLQKEQEVVDTVGKTEHRTHKKQILWDEDNTALFIRICCQEFTQGNIQVGKLSEKACETICEKLSTEGLQCSKSQIKNKWDALKRLHSFWHNKVKGANVEVKDEMFWRRVLKTRKSLEYKKLRSGPPKYMKYLDMVFDDKTSYKIKEKSTPESSLMKEIEDLKKDRDNLENELKRKEDEIKLFKERVEEDQKRLYNTILRKEDEIKLFKERLEEDQRLQKRLYNTIVELKGNMRVFVRVRPLLKGSEGASHISYPNSLELLGRGIDIIKEGRVHQFTYDRVFGPESSQDVIFEEVSELIECAINGSKVCIFTYGQTGSGKTYTMIGTNDKQGIIPRALQKIFGSIESYTVNVSIGEIYLKDLYDLLVPNHSKIQTAANLTEVAVTDTASAMTLLEEALRKRCVRPTHMNDSSSRSHFIFQLKISGSNEQKGSVQRHLNFIDLAGSERNKKSGSEGIALDEANAINVSLMELNNVFTKIANKDQHVSFRNSKLTLTLQPYLIDGPRTLLVVNVSPEVSSIDETICSLKYAQTAKDCLGKPKEGDHRRTPASMKGCTITTSRQRFASASFKRFASVSEYF